MRTFPTISAARRWRQDAYAAVRSGDLTAERGPTVREAADAWLDAARAGIVRNRSGDPYKPSRDPRLRPGAAAARAAGARATSGCARWTCRGSSALWTGWPPTGRRPPRSRTAITPLRAIYKRARQLGEVRTDPITGISRPVRQPTPGTLRHHRAGGGPDWPA